MYTAFANGGSDAHMVDFGTYKNNAHRLVGDRDGVPIWWPPMARFLTRIGLPTAVRYRLPPTLESPPPTGYAQLDAVDAVPYVDNTGRRGYQTFLQQYPSRAFALSDSGAWAWAEGGDDPLATALASCQKNSREPCPSLRRESRGGLGRPLMARPFAPVCTFLPIIEAPADEAVAYSSRSNPGQPDGA